MRHHPSLEEILQERCLDEWIHFSIIGISLGDFVDSENSLGSISSPSLILHASESSSELGTFSFSEVTIGLNRANESELQNLEGKWPVGYVNYYEGSSIGLNVNPELYDQLILFLPSGFNKLQVKICLPKLENSETKCLPVLRYQIVYKDFDIL